MRRWGTAILVAFAAALALPAGALADHTQISTFQDDNYLLYANTATVQKTLTTLQELGVQQVRINVDWAYVAPDPLSRTAPSSFDASDPASYPAANWTRYDQLVELAPLYGMNVEFNLTGPGPLWAMGRGAPTAANAPRHWNPSVSDFQKFATALGKRYSGSYTPPGATQPLPAVNHWSIWNEPNQGTWLAPQWAKRDGKKVPVSAEIYRTLLGGAYKALKSTGHAHDTILIGETAPEGADSGGSTTNMTPGPFLRALYCVGTNLRPLRGVTAKALGCPTKGPASAFAKANPALFDATGFAHHPYDFQHNPAYNLKDTNQMPLADIGRLERLLDGAFRSYGVHRTLPLYFTEYGYESKPDPHRGVQPATQATYLNESDYMAWANPRVRGVAQFLLYDALPNYAFKPGNYNYWDTFQTGLLYANGKPKPAFAAYRMPLWIPQARFKRGSRTFIWGQVRPADRLGSQTVDIQWRPSHGSYRTIATARTAAYTGYLTASVKLPGSGFVQLSYQGTTSRAAPVTQR